jgi:hypothetical protein
MSQTIKDILTQARKHGEEQKDSKRLINNTIRKIRAFYAATGEVDDVCGLYDEIVSSTVNNSRSSFYIYGR